MDAVELNWHLELRRRPHRAAHVVVVWPRRRRDSLGQIGCTASAATEVRPGPGGLRPLRTSRVRLGAKAPGEFGVGALRSTRRMAPGARTAAKPDCEDGTWRAGPGKVPAACLRPGAALGGCFSGGTLRVRAP